MVLHGRNGEEFSLRIIDYEFPDIKNDEWDSNWLLIETKVTLDGESWLMTDPCLLTWEVMWLANWLEAISHEDLAIEEVGFLEPNLYCKLVEYNDKRVVIRVFFELENKPKWVEATLSLFDKCRTKNIVKVQEKTQLLIPRGKEVGYLNKDENK